MDQYSGLAACYDRLIDQTIYDRFCGRICSLLQKNGITVVHTGDCTVRDKESGLRCAKINEIVQLLQERGIETVHGTHHK